MKILNTWSSTKTETKYYEVGKAIYQNGDYAIFKLAASYLHAYKNIAINELMGANKELIDHLANDITPIKKDAFYFNIERAKTIIENHK